MVGRSIRALHAGLLLALGTASLTALETVELPRSDAALSGQPEQLFTVGTMDGREREMFSSVRGVAFDRGDNLYVLDGQNHRVVMFDSRGRYVRQFGKRGGGPGELQAPVSMTVLANDEIVVNDIGNRAYTGVRTDPQGRIWVQRRAGDARERGPIDLLTAAGRYIGTLPARRLPDAFSASGLAAWIERDELDVERVAVRRLPAAWH